jgi:hypothetical protein
VQNRRYPPLSFELAKQLLTIEATGGLYRPCVVTLQDGTVLDRVYLAEAQPWFRHWGVWPEDDGFDFNDLKKYNYDIIINNNILDKREDWNPKENSHSNMILKPV